MNDEIRLNKAVMSYLKGYGSARGAGLWSLGEAGWLDENWFGVNQWGRAYSRNGRWWGGVRVSLARDRDPMSFAGLADGRIGYSFWWYYDDDANPWRVEALLQGGFSLPDAGLDFQIDYGRFIDEDMGGRLSVIRRWDDTSVGFWMSRTDNLAPGKNFTNAGVHLDIPAEKWFGSWFGRPSSHVWEHDVSLISAWRVDAGREPGKWRDPERMFSQLRPDTMKHNVEKLLLEYCAFDETAPDESQIRGITDFLHSYR
jgi:hypothetical protein